MFFFFFFQAEDGIRDVAVTGVQTCALPIYELERGRLQPRRGDVLGDLCQVLPRPLEHERLVGAGQGAEPQVDEHDHAERTEAARLELRRSEEHTSELQSRLHLVCRLLLEKKKEEAGPRRGAARIR